MRHLALKLLFKLLKKDPYRQEILTEAVKELYNTIGESDILQLEGKNWVFNGKKMNEAQVKSLVNEAQYFLNSQLWKIINTDVKYLANERMYLKSRDTGDMIFGKMWLYTLDALKTRLTRVAKGSPILKK